MSIYPAQIRTVDPYASYHSNVVNKLTRIASRGQNCIFSKNQIDVSIDTTSVVIISAGECFKDDVLIEITANHSVDFTDLTNYVSPGAGFNEPSNYYYIVLDYVYSKSRPAPQASIKILKPSQRNLISGANYIFLKAIYVDAIFQITSVHDEDVTAAPGYASYAKRKFTQLYIGLEFTFPAFDAQTDETRVIYVLDEDEIYYGTSTHWEPLSAVRAAMDTTTITGVGFLAYVNASGVLQEALATAPTTLADCVVTSYGVSGGDGMVRIIGPVKDVVVEAGITATVGDKMYLSNTNAGFVTNVEPLPYTQYVGVCTAIGTPGPGGTIDMWFTPSVSTGNGGGGGYGNANSFMYRFSTNTADADPGTGYLRFNNAVASAASVMFIDLQTAEATNPNISTWLNTLDDSDSTIKGTIKISRLNHPEVFAIYQLTGIATPAGYDRLSVTYIDGTLGAGTFNNGDYIVFSFSTTGDKGDQGSGYQSSLQGSATSWTITHNLNHRLCVVTVCDSSYNVIIPLSIVFDTVNQLTVNFTTAQAGYVAVY